MKKVTYLQNVEELICAFRNLRGSEDDFPYIGQTHELVVSKDGLLTLESDKGEIELVDGITWDELCDAMAEKLGITIRRSNYQ